MDLRSLVRDYVSQGRVMQLATARDGQPWICTVYYVEDDELNLYWLSLPGRRHSLEIARHAQVAVAVPIKLDQPVIGIQAEGAAEAVADRAQIESVMERYVERHGVGRQFYDNFVNGQNQHVLFRFSPDSFVLFDEVHFPGDARHELSLR